MLERTSRYFDDHEIDDIDEVEGQLSLLEDVWNEFDNEHELLGLHSRTTFFNHKYVTSIIYERAYSTYRLATSSLYRQKSIIHDKYIKQSLADAGIRPERPIHRSFVYSQLLIIKLPQFSGDFSSWLAFRDLFTSLVIDQQQLSNVGKLHYSKTSIIGSPAQLISNIKMSNDSFDIAWGIITTRFDNKERQIRAYVEKLFSANQ